MKLSDIFFIFGLLFGIYMFGIGLKMYKQKSKKLYKPKFETRKLIDKEGYSKFIGKHYITVGISTIGFYFANLIFTKLFNLEFIFIFYAFIFLCVCLRFMYCLCCKTDKYFNFSK